MDKRLIELALEALESKRVAVDKELQALKALLVSPPTKRMKGTPAQKPRRGMSPAARTAVSARMKAYWAKKRAEKSAGKKGGKAAK